MIIHRGAAAIADIKPLDTSYVTYAVMSENPLYLEFYSQTTIDIRRGDWVTVEGNEFFVSETPIPDIEKGVYKYSIKLLSTREQLDKVVLMQFGSPEIVYTCSPTDFLNLVVESMTRAQPTKGWAAGNVIAGDVKTLSFSSQSCLSAMQSAAAEWNTECWTSGFTIYFCAQEFKNTPVKTLSIGAGLKTITPEKNKQTAVFSRLYAYGSSRNLPANYGADRLHMDVPYIEDSTADEVIEHVEKFEEIYPRRTGTISGVRASSGIWYFTDSLLPFNPNDCQIAGLTKHVVFDSGACVGLDFEVNYNAPNGEFELINYTESDGSSLPSDPIVPAIGDTYKLYNIVMPDSYVTDAQNELKAKAQALLDKSKAEPLSLNITTDDGYFLTTGDSLSLGEIVNLTHPYIPALVAGREIRITTFKRYLNKPYRYESVKVSDIVYSNPVTTLEAVTEKIETVVAKSGMMQPNHFERNWRDVEEVSHMVDTLRASMLLIGNVQGAFTLQDVFFTPNAQGNPNIFTATTGRLWHKTIPTEQNPGDWFIDAFATTLTSDTTAYYLYAKCDRFSDAGALIASTTPIVYDVDPAFYHFFIGVISSLRANARTFKTLYGYTEISGNEIVTGKVASPSGKAYFDLENSEIGGNIKFLSNNVYKEVGAGISDAIAANNSAYVDVIKNDLQNQIDGQIISWFYQVDPTLTNVPASDWTTDAMKLQHANDTYTNIDTGGCWRWQQVSGVWGWGVIADTATQQALTAAGNAQDTADNKRRVFLTTPTVPYDIGDLYFLNKELYACISAGVGTFDIGDWEPATKYTDDTAANAAAQAAQTAQTTANNANAAITQVSSDSYLTPSDKLQVLQIWNGIVSERSSLETLATAFSVDSTAYEATYQTLLTYVNTLNLSNGTGQTITKTDFNTNFGNYFTARATLNSSISTAQKTLQGVTVNGTTFLQNGLVNASLIDVSNLFAKHIYTAASGARLTLNEVFNNTDTNELRAYDGSGNLMIRLGIDTDGLAKLMFFNSTGAKIYELSQNGIVSMNSVAASFTAYMMYKLTSTDINSTTEVEVVTLSSNSTIYAYNAGNDINTTNNKQYEAYKWTANTMNTTESPTGSHIPDGLYTLYGNASVRVYNPGQQTEYKVYTRTVSQYSNGIVTNSKIDSWTVYTYQ